MAKQKKCAYSECEEMFTPRNMQHKCHDYICAIQYQAEVTAKRKAKETRRNLKEFNQQDKSWLMKEAQKWFNKYIRERDKDLPCISCKHDGSRQRHASHYRPVGRNSKHRFNEMNVHSACSICNSHLSGNLVPYREELVKMYGIDKIKELECDNEPYSYSISELKSIICKYKSKSKDIENEM